MITVRPSKNKTRCERGEGVGEAEKRPERKRNGEGVGGKSLALPWKLGAIS